VRILVTGGTGVVGTGTVTELLARGHSVVLVSRHARDDARQWPMGVTAREGDVSDAKSLHGAADGCELVLHMAGIVEESGDATFESVNVQGTANVIAEAERAAVTRLVFISSLGAPKGESRYHRSKAAAEQLVRGFRGHWIILRPGNVYGPGDEQISLLLRLVRGPSPVVPTIGDGEQPMQPIWWEDCAAAIANAVERPDLWTHELDVAGPEVTSQNDLIRRLGRITGREVNTVAVPEFLAGLGAKVVSLVGWDMKFNDEQQQMLREGNVVQRGDDNALESILHVRPTSLDDGLRKLADLQSEQLPRQGIGALKRKRYWADIEMSAYSPETLFALFRTSFNQVTPVFVDAIAEPHTSDVLADGETITLALPMRGHVQVRVAELEARQATLLTLEGHPLAGAVRFLSEPRGAAVRFQVEVYERAANLIDMIAMRTLGDRIQNHTWTAVVERMIERSGGVARDGVLHDSATLDSNEAAAIQEWLEGIVLKRKREENAEAIGIG
jgi:Nucleoside-diphosphate-sugar epimerases